MQWKCYLPNIDGTAGDGDDQTDFTVDAGSGTVDVQTIDTDINDVIITGSTITLNGDITTAAGTGGEQMLHLSTLMVLLL